MKKLLCLWVTGFMLVIHAKTQNHYFISHVNIPSFTGGDLLEDQTVEIKGDRIIAISPSQKVNLTPTNTILDGRGQYLIPGLSEMHAHIPTPIDGEDSNVQETLFLYLANGITTIRGMLGDPYHLELKKQVDKNSFPSPRIYTSSPSLNGNTIPTKVEARTKVIQYKNDGYDFLKIHPGIKRDVFDEMASTANEVGIAFSGHVPLDVGIEHAIAAKYATIDHLDGYIEGLVPEEQRADGGFFGVLLAMDGDPKRMSFLVDQTKKAGVSVVPTQTLMTRWLSPKSPELMIQEPEMAYIPASLRFSWRQNKQQMLDRLNYPAEVYQQFIDLRQQLLRACVEADVPILLGSDAPQVFNVPGFSIHHEMRSMVDAGLSTAQVLASGTINVAHFWGADDRGEVAPGKVADLVLLSGNPLENIDHARMIEAVIYRGQVIDKNEISARLDSIATKYKSE